MTFNAPSFFAGVGTVLACLIVGFGGGILISGVLSDGTREPSKIERRAAAEVKPSPAPVTVAAPVPAAAAPVQEAVPAPQPAESKPPEPQTQPQGVTQSRPQPAPPQQAPPQPQTAQTLGPERPVSLTQPEGQEQREALPKRLERKLQAEKRKAERRKQRAEQRLEAQIRKEQEIRAAVERRRIEADDDEDARYERPVFMRRDRFLEPPVIRFFGSD